MNMARRRAPEPAVLELRLSGTVDEESIHDLLSDPVPGAGEVPSRWLVHTCTAQLRFDSLRLADLAERLGRSCARPRGVRVHAVAADALTCGCLRMLAAHLAQTPIRLQVYPDAETALEALLAA